jgi:hypothetical protein
VIGSIKEPAKGSAFITFQAARARTRALHYADDLTFRDATRKTLGDTLCRLHRPNEAWPYYRDGFELASGGPNLIALALQCLWDEVAVEEHEDDLRALGAKHRRSWLEYLARDTISDGVKNDGVDPKDRPRGYNEGPKE